MSNIDLLCMWGIIILSAWLVARWTVIGTLARWTEAFTQGVIDAQAHGDTVPVIFERMSADVCEPRYAHEGDSGMDLCAAVDCRIGPLSWALVHTGIRMEIMAAGYEAQVRSRSGLALKHGVFVLNSPGTIDNGYRGEVGVIICNLNSEPFHILKGDRIAQLVVCRVSRAVPVVGQLTDTERNAGGFGSTGVSAAGTIAQST